jgi:hypothetical protein
VILQIAGELRGRLHCPGLEEVAHRVFASPAFGGRGVLRHLL